MARRRKSTKKAGINIQRSMGVAAGAVAKKALINKVVPGDNMLMKGIAGVALGVFLPGMVKGNDLVAGMADGLLAVGALEIVGKFAPDLVAGDEYDMLDGNSYDVLEGLDDLMAGEDDDDSMYGEDYDMMDGDDDETEY